MISQGRFSLISQLLLLYTSQLTHKSFMQIARVWWKCYSVPRLRLGQKQLRSRNDSKEARFSCESLTFAANSRIAINQTWNQRIYLEWSAHFLRAKNSGITNWFKESCCRPYESPPPSESGNHQRRRSQPKHQSDFQIEHQHHPGNGSSNGGRDKTTFISPTNKSSKHQNR